MANPEEDDPSSPEYILRHYIYKEDVQAICENLGLPVSGSKEDLIRRLVTRSPFDLGMALEYVDKEALKDICKDLGLRASGTREELEVRILQSRASRLRGMNAPPTPTSGLGSTPTGAQNFQPPVEEPTVPRPPLRRELFAPQDMYREVPLTFQELPSPSLIPEARPPQVVQLQMVSEFLESYRPSQRFRNEQAYQIELAQAMRHHFGEENVKTQVSIVGGRIDIEVLGIGVEVKVPGSRSQLQTLLGQVSIYRNFYGPNMGVVIFNDFAKVQDVNEFSNILRGRGVLVFAK